MKQEIVSPSVDLLDSMRSVGYSLDAAIADLIDNSITAVSGTVIVDADVVNGEFIAVLDDGEGMTSDAAREALRLAGSVRDRLDSDLGRFGLGLKTASLSQARCLTLVTKKGKTTTGLRWDIDHVRNSGEWSLLILGAEDLRTLPLWEVFERQHSGTLVVWQRLDLLVGDAGDPGAYLSAQLVGLRDSLSLVFQRYLSGVGALRIEVNGILLKPTDPFLSTNPKTQRTQTEIVPVGSDFVEITAFTLPHQSALTPEERRRSDLGEGMRDAQGFYIYRNRRLISKGHWYGLARMSELSKQTRIQVDIPTSLDRLWQLDIKKSQAEPPQSFKQHLRRLIGPILDRGQRVHRFRGRREGQSLVTHVWNKKRGRDGFFYEINFENPLIEAVLSRLRSEDAESVARILQTVASSFPMLDAYQELAASALPQPFKITDDDLLDRLREIHDSGLLGADLPFVTAALRSVEPFNEVEDLANFVERVWGIHDATV